MWERERLRFEAYGVVVDLVVAHRCRPRDCAFGDLTARVQDRLPPGAIGRPDAPRAAGRVGVTCRGDRVEVTDSQGRTRSFPDRTVVLHVVDGAIRTVVAVHAPGLVFIHAGTVSVDGRAVVLPGRSFTGKTTLVAAMVEAGATYLSDEYAPIDAEGLVHPYPRRLSLRVDGGRREVSADALGGTTASGPCPIGLVASIGFSPGASWQVTDADQAACAEALLQNAVAAQIRPTEVLATSARVARATRYVHGVRGEATAAVHALRDLVVRDGA